MFKISQGSGAALGAAKFPVTRSLDSFDFKAIPRLDKMQALELSLCGWIERRENVIALGPGWTEKSHLTPGLGLVACQKGVLVGFTSAAPLINKLMEARDERGLMRQRKLMIGHRLLSSGLRGPTLPAVLPSQ